MANLKIPHQLINPQAIAVCRTLFIAGHRAFIVGGCVRDLLLGIKPKDWDITTNANPEQVMSLFPKTYPTGLQHGTITVAMGEGVENHFEVTTFRVEGEYKDGRRPEEVFFVMNVEQDLGRRDLTINAIAYDPLTDQLIDPFDGIQDLNNGIIRAVGLAEARFQEDGLRIMRVARFAARFGYLVDDLTITGMKASIETLKKVSKERIQQELSKTLMTKHPSLGIQLLLQVGALDIACPILTNNQINLLSNLDKCSGALETKLAILYSFCPVAKVQEELMNLKYSNKEVKKVIFLLELMGRYRIFSQKDTVLAYKSFMAVIKNHSMDHWRQTLEQFINLSEAIGYQSRELFEKYEEETVFSQKEMQINGNDLMSLGVKPGPQIKSILEKCYLEILRNPKHNTKPYLLLFVNNEHNN